MQKLAEVCIHRPVFAAMLVLSLVVVGAASYARLLHAVASAPASESGKLCHEAAGHEGVTAAGGR
jgi:hypothetical protein